MKVSVIIPVFNVEPYLCRALDCIINQTYNDLEIICIDDCSTDNSLNILKDYAKKDKRIKIIEQKENQGQGVARNIAIDIASGEYIMFLDPDDYYELYTVEKAYNRITETNADITFFNYKIHAADGEIEFIENRYSEERFTKCLNVKNDDIPYCGYSWAKIYKTDFLKKNSCKFGNGRVSEDIIFSVKTTCCADSISFLNIPLYHYICYKNANRNFRIEKRVQDCENAFKNRKISYDYVEEFYKKFNTIEKFRESFLKNYITRLIGAFYYYECRVKSGKANLYEMLYNYLKEVSNTYDVEKIKYEIPYSDFCSIVKHESFLVYWFKARFLNKIFSITYNKNRRTVTILGIKVNSKVKNV